MDKRSLITGKQIDQPQSIDEFTLDQKATFVVQLNHASNNLMYLARLFLLEFNFSSTQQIQAVNPNLFSLASMKYGDMRKWTAIAKNSQVSLPVLNGTVELSLPRIA